MMMVLTNPVYVKVEAVERRISPLSKRFTRP